MINYTWTINQLDCVPNVDSMALASTAVVGKALLMTYDVTTTKWYPSY